LKLYCDTNVLRYFSLAFSNEELPQDIRENVVVSSISIVELLSQLCDSSASQAFAAVRALWNWLPAKVQLLDIPPVFIRANTIGDDDGAEVAFQKISNALNWGLHARSAAELREASKELRSFLQRSKLSDAQSRADSVIAMRRDLRGLKRNKLTDEELRAAFRASIAKRVGTESTHPSIAAFAQRVEAYYQYETIRLQRAIENPNLNLISKKRQNDLFDAEQLIYLFAAGLCFLTSDQGYSSLLGLPQGERIRIVPPNVLVTARSASAILEQIIEA
jgi:hypothetical protein